MSSQHKKPILAFVVLAVVAAGVIGNQVRASAEGSGAAAGHISAHTSVRHGATPEPAIERPAAIWGAHGPMTEPTPPSRSVTAAGAKSAVHTVRQVIRERHRTPVGAHGRPVHKGSSPRGRAPRSEGPRVGIRSLGSPGDH